MLSKSQIIEGIQQINHSARQEWLDLFDLTALKRYLDHLMFTIEPRGRDSRWVRAGDTPAILTRQPHD